MVYNKYYVDEIYDAIIRKPLDAISNALHKFVDLQIVDGIVNGVGTSVKSIGGIVRMLQTGNIGFYIMGMAIGLIAIIIITFNL